MKRTWKTHTPEGQFFAKVNKNGPIPPHVKNLGHCWQWTASSISRTRYGQFRYKTEGRAHRCSWLLHYGPIPEGLGALHKCDNPSCVNPDHLFLGTAKDNEDDKVSKGRNLFGDRHPARISPQKMARGEANGFSKLTDEKVREIRNQRQSGMTLKSVAKNFCISDTLVSYIEHRKIWKHVR